jgi:coenzyme F420-0:L-glutamate ligase / coenzyme F420-1:gamma-L-glutamate ligase
VNSSALQTRIFQEGEDLFLFFQEFAPKILPENTIVVIASKIVALSQGRTEVKSTDDSFELLVKRESDRIIGKIPNSPFFLTEKRNILIANAGIDSSNAKENEYILWPENVQTVADIFLSNLKKKFSLQEAGVVISDSRITPRRAGTIGIALAWSGFWGVRDERGTPDIFGNPLKYSQVAVADNLSSVGEILMGTAGECSPFAILFDPPVQFTNEQQDPSMASFSQQEDLFSLAFGDIQQKEERFPLE